MNWRPISLDRCEAAARIQQTARLQWLKNSLPRSKRMIWKSCSAWIVDTLMTTSLQPSNQPVASIWSCKARLWRGERISNTRLSIYGANHFIYERWWRQGNNRACYQTGYLGQRQEICCIPRIETGKRQGTIIFLGRWRIRWSTLWPIPNCLQKKWSLLTRSALREKNAAMPKITSKKPGMIWPLGVFYLNPFGQTRPSFSWWCWPTICFCCSRWTLQMEQNTDSKSKHSGLSTYFWLVRSSERPDAW